MAIFQSARSALGLKTDVSKETIWANLNQISFLFDRDKAVISRQIKNIFKEKELEKNQLLPFLQQFKYRKIIL